MELIGTKIQTLRKNKRLTQAQLAEALSVSSQSVSKWENHLSVPDIALLPMIARYFGITMDELFNYRLDALTYRERFIRFMADNGVLQFGEFELQSGRRSPYFIRTGNYQTASQISKLGEFYAQCLYENHVESTLLAGSTSQEIPIMLATSMVLFNRYGVDMPYHINDSAGKRPAAGDRITLIKDTLTSGDTLRAHLQASKGLHGAQVSDIIVSVDRMERVKGSSLCARREIEEAFGVRIHAIVTLDDIIRAMEKGIIGGTEHLSAVKEYRDIYGGTSPW